MPLCLNIGITAVKEKFLKLTISWIFINIYRCFTNFQGFQCTTLYSSLLCCTLYISLIIWELNQWQFMNSSGRTSRQCYEIVIINVVQCTLHIVEHRVHCWATVWVDHLLFCVQLYTNYSSFFYFVSHPKCTKLLKKNDFWNAFVTFRPS